ncbi:unnamed protein product [Dovyalis caffra]|uniref:Uncharacterized protein n=1 Tax=Dovyalis caffra TaxID=77055 RepID=A0AAV1RZW1_9ROSI|nr:unnamed protein product [Dovyalis caffra]
MMMRKSAFTASAPAFQLQREIGIYFYVEILKMEMPSDAAMYWFYFKKLAARSRGEEYELFWPKQQEFVRMASRFGAKIVPFGAVEKMR